MIAIAGKQKRGGLADSIADFGGTYGGPGFFALPLPPPEFITEFEKLTARLDE